MHISNKTAAYFFRELESLLNSGMSLGEALELVATAAKRRSLTELVRDVSNELKNGSKFADALARHPDAFNIFSVEIVRAGETNGILVQTFADLASFAEQRVDAAGKIKRSLAYPAFLLLASIFLLPLSVLVTGTVADYLAQTLVPLAGICVAVGSVYYLKQIAEQNTGISEALDMLRSGVPFLGGLFKKAAVARFLRMFSMLIRSGVGPQKAVETAAAACGNGYVCVRLMLAIPLLDQGKTFSQALAQTQIIPPAALGLITTGEKSGSLEKSAQRAAEYYEKEVDEQFGLFMKLLPSVLLVIVGGYIGYKVFTFWKGFYSSIYTF